MVTVFVILMVAVFMISVIGALVWAVIHIARGNFREEYQIATAEELREADRGTRKTQD